MTAKKCYLCAVNAEECGQQTKGIKDETDDIQYYNDSSHSDSVVLFIRKNRELKLKNKAIINEVRRNQTIVERAVKLGVSRAALL